jgi:Txe/YoeB family toxin of Txe-Axe toxin-antitoxin module
LNSYFITKEDLPIQLKEYLESKAGRFGMPLAGYIKHLILKEVSDKPLFVKIQKQLKQFQTDPFHNSLRVHKLKGKLKSVWSISIDRKHRALY